ncbi:hypothetical protein ACFQBQ_18400 [Granulicella cerasi]|uniref:Uncharacterized protein n=1 Tax=Granulicella cerasi TaxID=741063 RepID=A0ABW1ZF42_9BACT|nr:hypothetical protein [Granulicella cerasi]
MASFLCAALSAAHAQTPDARELLKQASVHAADSTAPEQSFTYTILHRDLNYIKGKLTADHTYTSEQIFIGGLPYIRRLEIDGQPLIGKALERENALYDQAVKERTGLNEAERSRRNPPKHSASVQSLSLEEELTNFKIEIAGHEQVSGTECTVLDLTPLLGDGSGQSPTSHPALSRRQPPHSS